MKKLLRIICASLFIACCGCFLLACIDPVKPLAPQETTGGEGIFSLVIEGETESRTILPATVQSNFPAYTLVFSSAPRADVIENRTNSNLANSVTLAAATWNLAVTAYMDGARTKPAAQGNITNIEITAGANVSRSLELKPIIDNGTGTFSWNINYPAEVTAAGMKITPLNAATGTQEQTLYFVGGTPLVNKNNSSSPLSLNTGYYKVVFSLSNGEHSTGREEYLHIYQNMNSSFVCTFNQAHFTVLSVTNGNDSGPGSLRHAVTNAASGDTILIEGGVKTIFLKSLLTVTKSLTIAGNGVIITRDPSWTTIDDNSQLMYIGTSSTTTVTINRVHFKDARASLGSAVYIYLASVNLESCIFSGNQGPNNKSGNDRGYGAIFNNGTLSVSGNTFYGNIDYYGSAIYNNKTLTLTGNLFYGNTAGSTGQVVRTTGFGNVSSAGYNVVDAPFGTSSAQSGWIGQSTDKYVSGMPVVPVTFKPLAGEANVITTRPGGYPTVDFYGSPIPASNASAGAVQTTASGIRIDVSMNTGMGEIKITQNPGLTDDGLYNTGSFTFTATLTGPAGYSFQNWLVNNTPYTANPLTLSLSNHSRVQAVFGRVYPNSVRKVSFSGAAETVTLNGLSNNDIYLVKVNMSQNIVSAEDTGGPPDSSPGLQSGWYAAENALPRMGHPSADEFIANPQPVVDAGPRRSRAVFIAPKVGDTRMFYVETYYGSGKYVQKQAALRATGQYGNIWVMDADNGSSVRLITDERAQELAGKFDVIYPIETKLLGYEYGGGPGGDGGRDGDPKIQILVYNILDAEGWGAGVAGYFHSKDFYDMSFTGSNQAEIFYMHASQINNSLNYAYSTLVHEFQHMINFNMKYVKQDKTSQSWYNEMLSMMAQDVIDPLIGVPQGASVFSRLQVFLLTYNHVGVTEWTRLGETSYAKGFAFGAYLLRNYGGASLLQEILYNDSTNIESITAAMSKVAGNGLTFEEALRRYGEAMVFSGTNMPADVQSFDKTVEKTISGTTYTAAKFNIWTAFNNASYGFAKPRIFGLTEQLEMRQHSITVHQAASGWTGQSGTFSVTLQKPANPDVEIYLMIK